MQLDTFDGRRTATGSDRDSHSTTRGTGVAALRHPAGAAGAAHAIRERDQLERDRSEDALHEAVFRAAFERAVVGIAHTGPDGRWLRVNQQLCDLLGYTREELLERTFQDVTYSEDLNSSTARMRHLVAGDQEADEWDKRYVRKDGTLLWAHITVSLVRTPAGTPDFFITMVQDITERKRMEKERTLLLRRERSARQELEATNRQLQALQALTDIALSHLTLDDLLDEELERVAGVMDMEHVGILLLDEESQALAMRAARGPLAEVLSRARVAVGQGLPGRVAASRTPLIVDAPSAEDLDGVLPIHWEQLRSLAGVPLLVQDPAQGSQASRLVGVLIVGSATRRHFTEADLQLLQRAADRIALAVDRARLYAAEQDARRRAEAALARAQASETQAAARAEQLHTILETIADGVAVLDTDGRVTEDNRAYRDLHALAGQPSGFESLPVQERLAILDGRDPTTGVPLPTEVWPGVRALRGDVVTGSGEDIRVRALDGRELELNASAAPLRESHGQIAGAVVVLRDLTERNRLAREREEARADELAAREASRRLEQFLAIAAHDLRAPLTAVVGYLDLAAHQAERLTSTVLEAYPNLVATVECLRQRLEDAGQGAERLTRLLTVLFDTAAIRSGKLELRRAPADLVALVREQVEALRMAAPDRTIRLYLPRDGAPIPVEVDADRIGQVIANYVTNALKYSPADRSVEVTVEARGNRARVLVCDQGPGLPNEERARVWDMFHRAPGVTVQDGSPGGMQSGSLGLGLHISKAVITAHGGRVGVESTVGEGSTFWFTVPLAGPRVRPG